MSSTSFRTPRGGPPKPSSRAGSRPSSRSTRFRGLVLVGGVALALTLPLIAVFDFQRVTPNPLSQTKTASQAVSITYAYNASTPGSNGFGVRVHFDSSRLTFNSVTNVFVGTQGNPQSAFTFGPSAPQEDNGNEDADNSTNMVVLIAWAHTQGGFPGAVPQNTLFTINFTTAAAFNATTRVNVSAIDTAQGYEFQGQSALVVKQGAPTPTPLPPTPTPTPGPEGDFATIDIDADGEVRALSDGLLIYRYLASFRGTALTNDAVDTFNCTAPRCDAAGIEAYMAYILPQLDIDHDHQVQTLSDGVLVFRYLASFRGSNLTNDAVDTFNCTPPYCNAAGIEPYIQGLRTP